ncbi:MAG: hypothetical protein WC862_01520 [Patescibacteria group bacterium]
MPFTPFHFGPSAFIAFPLKKYLDIPVFVLANVVIDLEPLTVMVFNLPYPVHGFFHTLLGGIIIGAFWGFIAYSMKNFLKKIMNIFHLNYNPKLSIMIFSGILGFWFHVFIDSFMHADIKPLYPLDYNPLYQVVSTPNLYLISAALFIPALIFYVKGVLAHNKSKVD